MNLKFVFIIFLLKSVSSLKYHLVKSDGNILSINSLRNTIDDVSNDTIAVLIYENNINKTGWANLELKTFDTFEDDIQAYYAGALEGYITGDLINLNYENNIDGLCVKSQKFCESLKQFVENNKIFTEKMIEEHRDSDYWHQYYLIQKQLEGMQMGYDLWKMHNNVSINRTETKYLAEIFLLNIFFELSTLQKIVIPGITKPDSDHCSAIVKPLPDGSDLFVAHNTWSTYDTMIRIMKKYKFAFNSIKSNKKERIAGNSVSFSSYPAMILSGDDFYVISSGLVVQETTNQNHNLTLFSLIRADNMLFEFARNVIANRLANSGKEWTDLFGQYNSGTYNNQFMVVDYKLFKRGTNVSDLPNDLLWIIEQMPTMIRAEDVTHVLRSQGYWASYNVPYFMDQFNMSGNAELAEKYGPFYTHNNSPRARIFRREQPSITNMKTLYELMRYNDFRNDPLSLCKTYNQTCNPPYSSELTIAARDDLNDPKGNYPIYYWSHRGEGAIDAKMTNSSMVWNLEMLAVSGPTDTKEHTPFQWSKTDLKLKHIGQPDLFYFKPIYVKWYPNSYEMANDI